jgi:hypothetical protein
MPHLNQSLRRLLIGLTVLCLTLTPVLPLSPAMAQTQFGRQETGKDIGKTVKSWREEPLRLSQASQAGADSQGKQRPDWVEDALRRGLDHCNQRGEQLRIADSEAELRLSRAEQDDSGQTRVYLDQFHHGTPVFGGQLIVQLDAKSAPEVQGRLYEEARIDATPDITSEQAIASARAALGKADQPAAQPQVALILLPHQLIKSDGSSGATLAWQVGLRVANSDATITQHQYFVDAKDGSIAWHYESVLPAEISNNDNHAGQNQTNRINSPFTPYSPSPEPYSDFDGDGKTDIAIVRFYPTIWDVVSSKNGASFARQWGTPLDYMAPGDYDGDGKTDHAVWRPSDGTWWVIPSSTGVGTFRGYWGLYGDVPVPGDYDGDGKTDLTVWRPSNGVWYTINSSTGLAVTYQWGQAGDVPVRGDYDGDGRTDCAVWRPSTAQWYVISSRTGVRYAWGNLGLPGDVPVPGDYDGDGRTDFAVYRPYQRLEIYNGPYYPPIIIERIGWWYVRDSFTGVFREQQWGTRYDEPVPGDYDGDRKTDMAVRGISDGSWWIIRSTTGAGSLYWWWGSYNDLPVPGLPRMLFRFQ